MISTPQNKWKAKCGGVGALELKWLRELGADNTRLKKMYAEVALEKGIDWAERNHPVVDALNKVVGRQGQ